MILFMAVDSLKFAIYLDKFIVEYYLNLLLATSAVSGMPSRMRTRELLCLNITIIVSLHKTSAFYNLLYV